MTDEKKTQQPASAGDASSGDTTTHTGRADPNQAADMMKDKDQTKADKNTMTGASPAEGADTDGAGSGGMVEGKDAGGGPAGAGGSSGSAG